MRHKCRMEGTCMFQGQIGKLPLRSQGNWAFLSFNPIFPLLGVLHGTSVAASTDSETNNGPGA